MGLYDRFLPPHIKPISSSMILIGRAMTVLQADCYIGSLNEPRRGLSSNALSILQALDDLKRNEIYVSVGASPRYALWGELMTLRAMYLRGTGAVLDGYYRDTKEIIELGFPCFGLGAYAQDQGPRSRVADLRTPVKFGSVLIEPGDIVFGDLNGVIAVPREAEDEAFRGALEKARAEKALAKAMQEGVSAVEAFKGSGIF
jgi:regulator of RNase E activity RraA